MSDPSVKMVPTEPEDHCVELRGFEPLTFCMPYSAGLSPGGAWRRHASRLPAVILARCGLTLPGACRRWLPTWLPGKSLAALTSGRPNRLPTAHPSLGTPRHRDPLLAT
jgi:hypothetical protein